MTALRTLMQLGADPPYIAFLELGQGESYIVYVPFIGERCIAIPALLSSQGDGHLIVCHFLG